MYIWSVPYYHKLKYFEFLQIYLHNLLELKGKQLRKKINHSPSNTKHVIPMSVHLTHLTTVNSRHLELSETLKTLKFQRI